MDNNHSHLEEGCLYVYKKGVLEEIQTDPDDLMRKIKITPDAFAVISELQNQLRQQMSGYRPDVSTICSALLKNAAAEDNAIAVIRQFVLEIYKGISEVGE